MYVALPETNTIYADTENETWSIKVDALSYLTIDAAGVVYVEDRMGQLKVGMINHDGEFVMEDFLHNSGMDVPFLIALGKLVEYWTGGD